MKFYDCAPAPSPRRVRMFIAEKKSAGNNLPGGSPEIPVVEVDLGGQEQHTEAFASINPYRTVPVLELDDGTALTTSRAICLYLEEKFPEPVLFGRNPQERAQIADLDWRIEQDGFLAVGESFRNRARSYKNNALTGKHQHAQIPELVERGRARASHFMQWLDGQLDQRQFVAGDHFSVADITAFITIDFARWIKLEAPAEYVNLHRWFDEVSKRPSASL